MRVLPFFQFGVFVRCLCFRDSYFATTKTLNIVLNRSKLPTHEMYKPATLNEEFQRQFWFTKNAVPSFFNKEIRTLHLAQKHAWNRRAALHKPVLGQKVLCHSIFLDIRDFPKANISKESNSIQGKYSTKYKTCHKLLYVKRYCILCKVTRLQSWGLCRGLWGRCLQFWVIVFKQWHLCFHCVQLLMTESTILHRVSKMCSVNENVFILLCNVCFSKL